MKDVQERIFMKKAISILLTTAICLSTSSINSYATNVNSDSLNINNRNITEYISPSDQLAQYLARTDITSSAKKAAIDKHNLGQRLASGVGNDFSRTVHATEKVLDVPWYSQTNSYYCGPATVKQTLQYLNDKSDSQSDIASDLGTSAKSGTDTNTMKNYLNNKTDCSYEVLWWWADADAFSDMVISDTDDDIPIIGHVVISTKGDWPFTTSGHYINYNGYSSSGEIFYVTDPYVDRYGNSDGKYTISNDEAERVTDRIIW